MNFGHFDDVNKEYVITTPDTPLPWINYLGSQDFFSLISNTCGGYSFYKDAKLLRITRYRYNNIPVDSNGKYYYIKDGDSIWNPGAMPTRTSLDAYECRHGLGYSRFHGEKNGLAADLLAFVPVDTPCEINKLTLKNNSDAAKEISLFSYVEFCLWNAVDDMTNYQRNLSTGEVEIIGSTIYHKTEYRERRNHYSFFTVNAPVDGFDTSRDDFLGLGRGNSRNSVASGWYPIASQQINVTLAPGEEKEFVFLLGYCENPKDDKWEAPNVIKKDPAKKIMEKFAASKQVDAAFAQLNAYWDELLSRYHVESQDPHVNRMANIWNQYQCMVTFNMSRSASYYESGTGDYAILDEMVAFDCHMEKAATLFEHLRRSFEYSRTHLGPHKLPLIGRADWNDCLNLNCFSNEPGESFQTTGPSEGPVAESVFIAGMYVKYGNEFAEICRRVGKEKEAEIAQKAVDEMYQAVLDAGWDGEWFLRAYDAASQKVGSHECEEGQIFIEPQGFCIIAGIGVKEGLAKKALDSVKERLDTKYGIMLHQPAYTRYYLNLGEISSYPPGYKENAGIFCHNNPWISIAETVIGRGNRAFEIYKKTCPSYIENISEIHRTEPYVYSQMIAGRDAARHGEAKNSWLTGTAAWTFVNLSQAILGVQPTYDGLSIDPCIPEGFGDFTLTRRFRGATYYFDVKNPSNVEKGVAYLDVDGKRVEGNVVPVEDGKKEYHVTVHMA